jgi:transcriptional regulator with XRE-family HTH domain
MRSHGVDPDDLARMTPARIGELLRGARHDRAVSVEVVAHRAGVKRRELKRWEKGETRPTVEQIGRLAAALDLSVEGLVPPRHPVAYHKGTGTLTVGDRTAAVVRHAEDADGNEAVLRTYVDAVARSRGVPPATSFPLRRDDIAVLAELLDLDDVDLEARLVRLLGLSAADAAEARRHLIGRRAVMLAATATAGVIATFPLAAAASSADGATNAPASSATTVVATIETTAPSAPVVVTASAAPADDPTPSTEPAPTPVPVEHPVSDVQLPNDADGDGLDIGTALVIERGTQPDTPGTEIGDAIQYGR